MSVNNGINAPVISKPSTTISWTGAWSANSNVNFQKIGKLVIATFDSNYSNTAGSLTSINAAPGSVPSGFEPVSNQTLPCYVVNASAGTLGVISVGTDGSMNIFSSITGGGPFTIGQAAGIQNCSVCWLTV